MENPTKIDDLDDLGLALFPETFNRISPGWQVIEVQHIGIQPYSTQVNLFSSDSGKPFSAILLACIA